MSRASAKEATELAAQREKRERKLQALDAEYREILGMHIPADYKTEHQSTPTEIEKKWRFTALPTELARQVMAGSAPEFTFIRQGYTETGVRLREETHYERLETGEYRIKPEHGKTYKVSYKTYLTEDGIDRYESPGVDLGAFEGGEERFRYYWDTRVGQNFVEKRRFLVSDGEGFKIDLDIYEPDPNTYGNLITAEIEFPSNQVASSYALPPALNIPGFVTDVTRHKLLDARTLAEIRGGRRDREGNRVKPNGPNGNGKKGGRR